MPGHVKLGKAGEPDPDPSPYLVISMDMKREAMAKPYDAKKSVWVPDGDGGFLEAMLDSESGGKTTVMCGHEVTYKLIFNLIYYYIFSCKHFSLDEYYLFEFRKRPSRVSWLGKSILPSLKNVKIWLT